MRMEINNLEEFLDLVQDNSIVFVLYHSEQIIKNDKTTFINTIRKILDRTTGLKIILTLRDESHFNNQGLRIYKTI